MSFDLLLNNGDISIGSNADLDVVVNTNKFIQDVIKFITQPIGSAKFQPQIGSLINERLIGQILTPESTVSILQSSIQEALILLQKLQRQQSQVQALSPAETLVSITSIGVQRDTTDPRQLNVVLKLMTADNNLTTENFTMRLS